MTISTIRGSGLRPSFKQFGIAFVLASLLGGMAMSPASADGYHGHRGRGGYHHRYHDRRDWRGGPDYQPYAVYAPPPVYYPPPPSPGVSLFFPIRIR